MIEKFAYMSTITSIAVDVASSDRPSDQVVEIIEGGVGHTFVALQFSTARTAGDKNNFKVFPKFGHW